MGIIFDLTYQYITYNETFKLPNNIRKSLQICISDKTIHYRKKFISVY